MEEQLTADLTAAFAVNDAEGIWHQPAPTPAERQQSDSLQVVVAMRLAYRGEPFCGFAKQPGQLTVQGSVEDALAKVFRHPVETVCAGRTDSGVHARGQWVSFSLTAKEWNERSEFKILKSLNALTHEDISVREIVRKDLDFSARFSARSREYRYFICTDQARPLLMRDFSWHLGKQLDLDAMRKAASFLIGEHDFRSFCMAASAEGKSTNRNVVSIDVEECQMWGENLVCITVIGNAFLHSMVRTIVGTLVMVGRGKRKPEWVAEVLEARNRSAAGENAPAAGLVFWKVNYEGEFIYDPNTRQLVGQGSAAGSSVEAEAAGKGAPANSSQSKGRPDDAKPKNAKAAKKRRLRDSGLFDSAFFHADELSFEIPRGVPREEGQAPVSGAFLSEVRVSGFDDVDDFTELDVTALRNPTNVPGYAGTIEAATTAAFAPVAPEGSAGMGSLGWSAVGDCHVAQSPISASAETNVGNGSFGELEWDLDLDEGDSPERDYALKIAAQQASAVHDIMGEEGLGSASAASPAPHIEADEGFGLEEACWSRGGSETERTSDLQDASKFEPGPEVEPELEPEPVPGPESGLEPGPATDPEPESELEPAAAPEPEPAPEPTRPATPVRRYPFESRPLPYQLN